MIDAGRSAVIPKQSPAPIATRNTGEFSEKIAKPAIPIVPKTIAASIHICAPFRSSTPAQMLPIAFANIATAEIVPASLRMNPIRSTKKTGRNVARAKYCIA
nr:hypothetical protein [Aquamicrobium defluvii]